MPKGARKAPPWLQRGTARRHPAEGDLREEDDGVGAASSRSGSINCSHNFPNGAASVAASPPPYRRISLKQRSQQRRDDVHGDDGAGGDDPCNGRRWCRSRCKMEDAEGSRSVEGHLQATIFNRIDTIDFIIKERLHLQLITMPKEGHFTNKEPFNGVVPPLPHHAFMPNLPTGSVATSEQTRPDLRDLHALPQSQRRPE